MSELTSMMNIDQVQISLRKLVVGGKAHGI